MLTQHEIYPAPLLDLVSVAETAATQVPPLWPLEATVAVNPFLGQTGEDLATAAARLARVAGIPVTLPRQEYLARIASGEIAEADIAAALEAATWAGGPASVADLQAAAARPRPAPRALPTVAELVAEVTGTDWPGIVADRIGHWAGAHFDRGQALWASPHDRPAFEAWCDVARRDLTPEILGLPGFCAHVAGLPQSPRRALGRAAEVLGLAPQPAATAFHRLLSDLGGWAQMARQLAWSAGQTGGSDRTLTDLLTIRLVWDEALFLAHRAAIAPRWAEVVAAHATPVVPGPDEIVDALLQDALDRAAERRLAETFAAPAAARGTDRPEMQAAFCIDVRSEVYRRALESVDPGIETLGFAGFFGLAVTHCGAASDVAEARAPVLLTPALDTRADMPAAGDRAKRLKARAARAWGRFRGAAVSSFAFVEAAGPLYAGKLVRDALGLGGGAGDDGPPPRLQPMPPVADRVGMAATVLGAMSLTSGFARVVVIAGHGAGVVNNPHESALHCGACGGHSGEVNARLLAGLLNDSEVRAGLAGRGIEIPADTLFVAALHDTTADRVRLFAGDHPAPDHAFDLAKVSGWLDEAGRRARAERALALPGAAKSETLARRGRDWSEVRPEWGLAGCRAFLAAPRGASAGRDLGGQVFLHSYDWRQDAGFGVLELILTAPVVVASWISLQYYGSTVAPQAFGAGNKLLHNVVGGIGVLEGNGGPLRAGLARQSVHDGAGPMHDPLRLAVVVAAPAEAIAGVLDKHPQVRELFDNGWLSLHRMDDEGRIVERWRRGQGWAGAEARALAAE